MEIKYLLNVHMYSFIQRFDTHTTLKTCFFCIKFIFMNEETFPKISLHNVKIR